jgi:hypothetical protein
MTHSRPPLSRESFQASADLYAILRADEAEVVTQFDEEVSELEEQAAMQISFGVVCREAQKLQHIGIFEDAECVRVHLSRRW